MKKTISAILTVAMLACVVFTLVSCGGLSGTYEGTVFDLKFKGDNVTIIVGEGDDEMTVKGTYKITEENDKKYISFDFVDEDEATEEQAYVLGIANAILSGKMAFAEEGKTITLGSGLFASKFTKK